MNKIIHPRNILKALIFSIILVSCDSPRSQRALSASSSNNSLNNNLPPAAMDWGNSNSNSVGNTSTTPASIIPSDASHCKFASDGATGFESSSTHLGEYTLCQSSTNKSVMYFQLKTPPTNTNGDVSICLIPTTSNGSNSIYVGNPLCGQFKDPKSVRKITFIKYAQYSNANINGVMFFKDLSWPYPVYYKYGQVNNQNTYYPVYNNYINSLDAYRLCMDMLSNTGKTTNCDYFKSVGQYVYKQFN
jgi:hypothetical protein